MLETEQQERGSEAAKGRERFDRNGKVYRRGKEQGEIGETVELLTGIERPTTSRWFIPRDRQQKPEDIRKSEHTSRP